jgi:ABC-type polysaccharide/polyol phosphate export permease
MIQQLATLFRYRILIQSLVSRDLKARYRGSVLGFLWSFIHPILSLVTYTFVFTMVLPGRHASTIEPYYLFFFCGLLPWTWFSGAVQESAFGLIVGGNLIKKVLFPAEVLPVVTVLGGLIHFFLGLPILLVACLVEGRLGWTALLLPLPILVQLVFTLGLALMVSALTVHFRDIYSILGHLMQLWFFASPVLYYYGDIQGPLRTFLRLNPMAHVVVSYQEMLFFGTFHHYTGLALAGLASLLVFAAGAFVFDRLRDTFAEEV